MFDFALPDGATLSYQCWGDPDAPVVVLLHDLLADHREWFQCGMRLANEYRIIAPDLLPLAGGEGAAPSRFTVERLAQDVRDLLAHEQVALCAIGGCGLGAAVALELAEASPEMTAAVVLADMPAGEAPVATAPSSARAEAVALRFGMREAGKRAAATLNDSFLGAGLHQRYARHDAEAVAAAAAGVREWLKRPAERRRRITVPVLLLAPEEGLRRAAADDVTGESEQLRFALFRDVETSVMGSRPDALCEVVLHFLHDIEDGKPIAAQLIQ